MFGIGVVRHEHAMGTSWAGCFVRARASVARIVTSTRHIPPRSLPQIAQRAAEGWAVGGDNLPHLSSHQPQPCSSTAFCGPLRPSPVRSSADRTRPSSGYSFCDPSGIHGYSREGVVRNSDRASDSPDEDRTQSFSLNDLVGSLEQGAASKTPVLVCQTGVQQDPNDVPTGYASSGSSSSSLALDFVRRAARPS